MGKGDATKTFGFYMTIPEEWKPKLEAKQKDTGALSLQDVVRDILSDALKEEATQ